MLSVVLSSTPCVMWAQQLSAKPMCHFLATPPLPLCHRFL